MHHFENVTILLHRVIKQRKENTMLKKQMAVLEAQQLCYAHPKDSSNSSKPSFQDLFFGKRTQYLRETSERKSGGQLEHEGAKAFAVIRSGIDAVLKNRQNVSDTLNLLARIANSYKILT